MTWFMDWAGLVPAGVAAAAQIAAVVAQVYWDRRQRTTPPAQHPADALCPARAEDLVVTVAAAITVQVGPSTSSQAPRSVSVIVRVVGDGKLPPSKEYSRW
ncbi:hypothetical protein ACIGBL_01840 [Streptomyces sp. NPDC085614]|uniref:hypothetical protein n=1 Tax=Streptomyces sp. NPDC085614 TaxID=3365733 RepID=UPI0037D7DC40